MICQIVTQRKTVYALVVRIAAFVLVFGLAGGVTNRAAVAQDTVLDRYIAEGLRSNLALQQREIAYEQARQALAEARGRFLPALDVEARYTRAGGGRVTDLPVGDLVNPVYRTLNELTGRSFPTVENQEIEFLRDPEQQTTLRLTQPVFEPRVLYGYRTRRHEAAAENAAVEAYRRELVRDIKVAYYTYQQAARQVEVLEAAEDLVAENRRTNQSLFQAARVTQDVVYRAEAEVLDVRQQIAAAEAQQHRARMYVNFLLNRSLDVPVESPQVDEPTLVARRSTAVLAGLDTSRIGTLAALQDRATARRAELDQLAEAAEAAENARRLAQSAYLPSVALALDVGIQGEEYAFTGEAPFYLGSIVLRWNLFNGFQDRARVQQARLQTQQLRTRRDEVARQIEQQVANALNDVRVAERSLQTAQARARAAREGFRLTNRRYEAGRANQVTFTDARTTLTGAELNLNVTRYDLLTRLAELEYAAGLYPLQREPTRFTSR